MFRRNIRNHEDQKFERIRILLQHVLPALVIHIGKVNLHFTSDSEVVGVLVLHVEVVGISFIHVDVGFSAFLVLSDSFDCLHNEVADAFQCKPEG